MAEPAAPAQARSGTEPRSLGADATPRALALVTIGAAWSLLFLAVYLVEGATRPGYDPWTQPVSALSLGPGGWLQQANFVALGLAQIVAALGWRWTLRPGPVAWPHPALRALTGLGLVAAGIFSQDPTREYPPGAFHPTPTLHGEVHVLASFVTFTALMVGCFVLAARFARTPGWRGWAVYAVVTGLLTPVLIPIFGQLTERGPAGLFERLAITVESILVALVVGRLWLQRRRTPA
ncbi:MAG TPA: DUF998 domain-containing protein [Candidatus Dormibacteraeota bacterium]|nr:DUF998 domain-containing protein [Candidatus Dormibacteraeota bacterium]